MLTFLTRPMICKYCKCSSDNLLTFETVGLLVRVGIHVRLRIIDPLFFSLDTQFST